MINELLFKLRRNPNKRKMPSSACQNLRPQLLVGRCYNLAELRQPCIGIFGGLANLTCAAKTIVIMMISTFYEVAFLSTVSLSNWNSEKPAVQGENQRETQVRCYFLINAAPSLLPETIHLSSTSSFNLISMHFISSSFI